MVFKEASVAFSLAATSSNVVTWHVWNDKVMMGTGGGGKADGNHHVCLEISWKPPWKPMETNFVGNIMDTRMKKTLGEFQDISPT